MKNSEVDIICKNIALSKNICHDLLCVSARLETTHWAREKKAREGAKQEILTSKNVLKAARCSVSFVALCFWGIVHVWVSLYYIQWQ